MIPIKRFFLLLICCFCFYASSVYCSENAASGVSASKPSTSDNPLPYKYKKDLLFGAEIEKEALSKVDLLEKDHMAGKLAFAMRDYNTALRLWRPIAERGFVPAQVNIAWMYHTGTGVTQSYSEAVKWYRQAAQQNDMIAENNLGVLFENGQGLDKDFKQAYELYQRSADHGYAQGQYNLATLYYLGKYVPKNIDKAILWYKKAAEQDMPQAFDALKEIEKKHQLKIDIPTSKKKQ